MTTTARIVTSLGLFLLVCAPAARAAHDGFSTYVFYYHANW